MTDPLLLPSAVLSFACTVQAPPYLRPQRPLHLRHSAGGGATAAPAPGKELPGMILEIRQLHLSPDTQTHPAAPSFYAFVRWKDADHRQSGWYPLSAVSLKEPAAVLAALSSYDPTATASMLAEGGGEGGGRPLTGALPAAAVVRRPLLSTIYREVTPGMARTLRAKKPLHFLEERLLRDDATPTTVRYFVYLNTYLFAPWYYAPYGILQPEYDPLLPVARGGAAAGAAQEGMVNPYLRDAHLCPFSLRLFSTPQQLQHELRHHRRGRLRPPGAEIYRDEQRGISVMEVNGSRYKTFCRHLFLLGKSFLENKLAGHDVHNYFFFVVCLHQRHFPSFTDDPAAMAVAGYFSWEKHSEHNLACIVTLPCFAGSQPSAGAGGAPAAPLHLGRFMIALSYALSRQRGQVGGPERPLSDLGEAAYKRYWAAVLARWMRTQARALQGRERRPHNLKRPRSSSPSSSAEVIDLSEEEDEDQEEEEEVPLLYEAADDGSVEVSTTVRDMARAVRLEEPDVLKALLAMGVLHRNAEDRSTRLLLPPVYLEREAARLARHQRSTAYAIFSPACWHEPCSRQVTGPGLVAATPK